MSRYYYGHTEPIVDLFVKKCPTCQYKARSPFQAMIKPIIPTGIFERAHIDLIDMRCMGVKKTFKLPNKTTFEMTYNWIAHMVDHNAHFHVLWPQFYKEGMCMFLNWLVVVLLVNWTTVFNK